MTQQETPTAAKQKPKKVDATAKSTKKTETFPKAKYKNPFNLADPLQSKFVNCIMKHGKKSVAIDIVKNMFDDINNTGNQEPLKVFELAFENIKPVMEVRSKRIGGAVYQIPIEVSAKRQQSLSIRWILEGVRKRSGSIPTYRKLAQELLDAVAETGYAFTKKEETHRMAQANKAFAHLARY